jgi:hypothetical protein
MDIKKITAWFSRGRLGGVIVAATMGMVLQTPPAMAQQFSGQFSGPSQILRFSAASGPAAVINMPVMAPSNFDPAAAENAAAGGAAMQSLGNAGSGANTSYLSGEAPEDAGMSGLTATNTSNPQQAPTLGPGNNVGFSPMTNGLMAPGSVNPTGIPLATGNGSGVPLTYGFNTSPLTQIYRMEGPQSLLDTVINTFGGGIITTGPVLPVTSTGSVNASTTMGNGY